MVTQLDLHCPEYFAQYEEQCGGGDDPASGDDDKPDDGKFFFKTHRAFAKFCQRLTSEPECLEMGCNWSKNKGSCDGKVGKEGQPKVQCKRIRNRSMCNSVYGCSIRKKSKAKRKNPSKTKLCKGKASFPDGMK